jgi:hypothetical protein
MAGSTHDVAAAMRSEPKSESFTIAFEWVRLSSVTLSA